MITDLEIFNPRIAVSPLPSDVNGTERSDPIQIRNIDGLGPVATTVNTTQYGSVDGEFYTGSNTGKRNIVITVGLNPDWASQTIESLRQILYEYFMPKTDITMRFTSTHMATVEIDGVVESCEPNLFAKDPEYVISVICPSPYFTSTVEYVRIGSCEALSSTDTVELDYPGNVEVGFTLEVANGTSMPFTSTEIRIYNSAPNLQAFIVETIVDATHTFEMSSVKGDVYAESQVVPAGVNSNIMGDVSPGSIWMKLQPKVNNFAVLATHTDYIWRLSCFPLYGGL